MAKVDYLIKFNDDGTRGETHDAVFMTDTEIADYQAKGFVAVSTENYMNLLGNNKAGQQYIRQSDGLLFRNQHTYRQRKKHRLPSCPNWTANMLQSWTIIKTLSSLRRPSIKTKNMPMNCVKNGKRCKQSMQKKEVNYNGRKEMFFMRQADEITRRIAL